MTLVQLDAHATAVATQVESTSSSEFSLSSVQVEKLTSAVGALQTATTGQHNSSAASASREDAARGSHSDQVWSNSDGPLGGSDATRAATGVGPARDMGGHGWPLNGMKAAARYDLSPERPGGRADDVGYGGGGSGGVGAVGSAGGVGGFGGKRFLDDEKYILSGKGADDPKSPQT